MESVRGRSRIGTNHVALVWGGGRVGSGSRSKWPEGALPAWPVWGWSSSSFLFPSLSPPRPAPLAAYRAVIPRLASWRAPSSFSIPFHPPCWRCSGSPRPSPGFLTPLVMTIIEYIQTSNQRPPGEWLFPPVSPSQGTPAGLPLCWAHWPTPFWKAPPFISWAPSILHNPAEMSELPRKTPHHSSNNARALFSNASAWSGKCLFLRWSCEAALPICSSVSRSPHPMPSVSYVPNKCVHHQFAQLSTHPTPSARSYLKYSKTVNLPGAYCGPAAVQML